MLTVIVIQAWAENTGVELETRHFGIVVVFHQFSKLKRILFQERSISHFPLLGFLKPV